MDSRYDGLQKIIDEALSAMAAAANIPDAWATAPPIGSLPSPGRNQEHLGTGSGIGADELRELGIPADSDADFPAAISFATMMRSIPSCLDQSTATWPCTSLSSMRSILTIYGFSSPRLRFLAASPSGTKPVFLEKNLARLLFCSVYIVH